MRFGSISCQSQAGSFQTKNTVRVNVRVSFAGESYNNLKLTSARAAAVPTVWLPVTEGHIRPYHQLPAPQTSGLPLLGQNTVGQELWPLLHRVNELLERANGQ